MKKMFLRNVLTILLVIMISVAFGCGKKEETAPAVQDQKTQNTVTVPTPPVATEQVVTPPAVASPVEKVPRDVAVNVDGALLKKNELAGQIKMKMNLYKDKIPADKKKEVQNDLKKQLVEEFVMRTLLTNEANKKKIVATKKEIQAVLDQVKANIPPEKKVEDFLKENNVTREDIAMGIRIRKLVELEAGNKIKPTSEDVQKFYKDNNDKFSSPETVQVRHILVTIDAKDDEKTKAEKKAKIDNLRKQILEGADFAEVAKNNSDCPSRENGGNLGEIKRGQTVKPFEDAAFSQEINVVGPVVTTEFGHHIIQVLGHTAAKTVPLDDVKDKIALYLEQQKQAEAFNQMTARLRKNAAIIYYEN